MSKYPNNNNTFKSVLKQLNIINILKNSSISLPYWKKYFFAVNYESERTADEIIITIIVAARPSVKVNQV